MMGVLEAESLAGFGTRWRMVVHPSGVRFAIPPAAKWRWAMENHQAWKGPELLKPRFQMFGGREALRLGEWLDVKHLIVTRRQELRGL